MWAVLLGVLTAFVFALPLSPALIEWQRRRDIRPLPIDGDHTLDVAAVAAEFRTMIDRQAEAGERGEITQQIGSLRPVTYVTTVFRPTIAEAARGLCKRTLVARGALALPDNYAFSRDLYGRQSLCTGRKNRVQALLSEGEIVLRSYSELHRWAHAQRVHVEPDCRLFGPISATQTIRLGNGCQFSSANAAVIVFGTRGSPDPAVHAAMQEDALRGWTQAPAGPVTLTADGRWLVAHDFTFPANRQFHGDLIVHGDLWIGTGARIAGSVKASGSIWLGAGVRIDGALIAADAISAARACAIAGPVAAEGEIDIGAQCVIGAPGRHTTVVAPLLRVKAGAVVHGAVCALKEGRVVADGPSDPSRQA